MARRITASSPRLTLTAALVARVDYTRRTLSGTVFRYGEVGQTSAGPLSVAPGALEWPTDVTAVGLTREHDRDTVRGHVAMVDDSPERLYIAARVADGPAGDAALAEASSRERAAFSFDLEDAVVQDGVITAARVAYMGQVANPAFNSARIDQIAAANQEGNSMTQEQRERLAALRAQETLTQTEAAELSQLAALEAAEGEQENPGEGDQPETTTETTQAARRPVAASIPPVPSGVPGPARSATTTRPVSQLETFIQNVSAAARRRSGLSGLQQVITAALADVTQTGVGGDIAAPGWSAELWSGLQYVPQWTPLLSSGDLTNWEGTGWRWVTKPDIDDYAGDKAAIPSAGLDTEQSSYEAARMAVGHDIDRKFFDFPGPDNAAFLRSYLEAVRESWAVKLDAKAEAYILANATAATDAPAGTSSFGLAARVVRKLSNAKQGNASFIVLNEDDWLALVDVTNNNVPAFLDMFGITPQGFMASPDVAAGTVIAGVKQAATVRTVPGSPIQVEAQNIANGGVDLGAFGYWAIEKHSTVGIQKIKAAAA